MTDTIAMCRIETATSVRSKPTLNLFYVAATSDDTEFVIFAVDANMARTVIRDRRRSKSPIPVRFVPIRMHLVEGEET